MARNRANVHKLTERSYCSLVQEWLKRYALVMPLNRNVLAMYYSILLLSWVVVLILYRQVPLCLFSILQSTVKMNLMVVMLLFPLVGP
jgi:uncharacterized membrane protein